MRAPVWKISIAGGSLQPCENYGVGVRALTFNNLQPDTATLMQSRINGAWVYNFTHGTPVRLYEDDNGTQKQVFCGLVNSPGRLNGASGRQRQIEIAGVMQLASELTYTYNYASAWHAKVGLYTPALTVTVGEQLGDVLDYLVARSASEAMVWRPLIASNAVSAAYYPQAEWASGMKVMDLIIKVLKPTVDAYLRVQYDAIDSRPRIYAGQFRDATPLVLDREAYPVVAYNCRRCEHEEATALVIQQVGTSPDVTSFDTGFDAFVAPTGAKAKDRDAAVIMLEDEVNNFIPDAAGDAVYESLIAARVKGTVELMGNARWLVRPGSVLEFDSLPHYVQAVTWNPAKGTITATIGPPRHLGFDDLTDLSQAAANGLLLQAAP